jgi:hypothetical protein
MNIPILDPFHSDHDKIQACRHSSAFNSKEPPQRKDLHSENTAVSQAIKACSAY